MATASDIQAAGTGSAHWLISTGRFVALAYINVLVWLSLFILAPTLIMGWSPMAVDSGSMGPTIAPGDVVLIDEPKAGSVDVGKIITFPKPGFPDRLLTHRVIDIDADGHYITKGDANADQDSTPVSPDSVKGVAKLIVPRVGLPVVWLQQRQIAPLLAWALSVMLALGLLGSRNSTGKAPTSPARLPRPAREPKRAAAPSPAVPTAAAHPAWTAPIPLPVPTRQQSPVWTAPHVTAPAGFASVPPVRYRLRLPAPPTELLLPEPPRWSVSAVPPEPGTAPIAPIPAPPVAGARRSISLDRSERIGSPRLHGPGVSGNWA